MTGSSRSIRFMYSYPLRYRRRMMIPQVLMLLAQLMGIAIPIVVRQAIDVGVIGGKPARLVGAAVAVILIGGLAIALKHIGKRVKFIVATQVVTELRRDMFERIMALGPADVDEATGGRALTRLTADTTGMRGVVNGGIFELVNQAILCAAYLTVCLLLDWRVALLATLPLLPSALTTLRVQYKLQGLFSEVRSQFTSLLSGVSESLANMHVVKVLGRERHQTDKLDSINTTLAAKQRRMRWIYSLWNAGLQVVGSLPTPIALWLGAKDVVAGRLSVGSLVALVALIMMFQMAVHMLTMDANGLFHTKVIGDRLLRIFDAEPVVRDLPDAHPVDRLVGRITASGVALDVGGHRMLHDVDLDVAPGEFAVLIGPTGSGKSLLLQLLARLRDPAEGMVLLDGADARTLQSTSLRRHVVCLPQRQWVFEGTLADNIRFARPDASDDDVREAAVAAGIGHLPLDRTVAAGAPDLSAGERQRVGIARALLVDPTVLLLDNPTANLDAETEATLIETILRLRRSRTLVVATQQPAFARGADHVYLVADGTVRDSSVEDVTGVDRTDVASLQPAVTADGGRRDG